MSRNTGEVEEKEAPVGGEQSSGVSLRDSDRHAARRLGDAQELVGRRVGAYEIIRFITKGGMGLVFAGRDVRLGRTVAIKVLPSALTSEASNLARFVREAKILASLSHANVATVYGLEEDGADAFLIMEFVEGSTLAARLASGALTVAEALEISVQIASAVEEAHRADVIHRDLKPGNVMITLSGRVKVLDFGLAREIPRDSLVGHGDAFERGATNITSRQVIMGTPGYMSPEQACGDRVDTRTDVFAFGAILYECLTGQPAFRGKNVADVIAGVLSREPDWGLLPEGLPRAVREILGRCLEKDVAARPRGMSEVRQTLEDALRLPRDSTIAVKVPKQARAKRADEGRAARGRIAVPLLVLGTAIAASGITYVLGRPSAPPSPPPLPPPRQENTRPPLRRLSIPFPGDHSQQDLAKIHVSIARDGSRLAFTAPRDDGHVQLWVRRLDEQDAIPVVDVTDPQAPFLSPDGQWVAYVQQGLLVKRRIAGGEPLELAPHHFEGQGAWTKDGGLLMAPFIGLARLPAQGGKPKYLASPDLSKGEISFVLPSALRDDSGALYTVWSGREDTRVDAIDFATGRTWTVLEKGSSARVADTPRGRHLLWERRGTIYAAPFDETTRKVTGAEHALVDGVLTDAVNFGARFDVSDDGTLVYIPGKVFQAEQHLVWAAPGKERQRLNDERLPFAEPHFSADGKRLSALIRGRVFYLNIYDLALGTSERLPLDTDISGGALSPDGQKLAYAASGKNGYDLRIRVLRDGTERLLDTSGHEYTLGLTWSPDGRYIAFSRYLTAEAIPVLWVVPIDPPGKEYPIADGITAETFPAFSPNGKWLAYAKGDERDRQVYIRSFPDGRLKRQLTTGGGDQPHWAPDGKSLYFTKANQLHVVDVSPDDGKLLGAPRLVPSLHVGTPDEGHRSYTVAPDGRLLLVAPAPGSANVSAIHVILGWERLLPDPLAE